MAESTLNLKHSISAPRLDWRVPAGFLLILTAGELLTVFTPPAFGLLLHGGLLIGMFALAASQRHPLPQGFLLALSLAPLIRLMSLSLPLTLFPFSFWYMVVGTPLLLAAFGVSRFCRLDPIRLGIVDRGWLVQVLIGLTGIGLGYIEYYILRPEPLVASFTLADFLPTALILMVFTGFLEEFIFRGVMQYMAVRALGTTGLVFISAVFAVLHIGYRSLLDVVFVFIVALAFAWIARQSKSILGVTLAHGLTNISLFLVYPFVLGGAGL